MTAPRQLQERETWRQLEPLSSGVFKIIVYTASEFWCFKQLEEHNDCNQTVPWISSQESSITNLLYILILLAFKFVLHYQKTEFIHIDQNKKLHDTKTKLKFVNTGTTWFKLLSVFITFISWHSCKIICLACFL